MNNKVIKVIIYLTVLSIFFIIFNVWFSFSSLSSGDWSYKFPEAIRDFTLYPYAWDVGFSNGLGGNTVFLLGLNTYYLSTIALLFNFFHIPWVLIERILWFWPFLLISVLSSYFLFKKLFLNKFALLSSFIFIFNTYILMIVSGGQMGIAMAYALAPLVLYLFIKTIDFFNSSENNFQFSILNFKLPIFAGLLFSLQIIFDLRIAYITLSAVAAYAVLSIMNHVLSIKTLKEKILSTLYLILYTFLVPGTVTFLLHSFWIIPLISGGKNPLVELGSAYSSLEAVKFFSFAKFENTLSLLHPNWPENIFGKVGFLKPEFIMLPILAFGSLFFIGKGQKSMNNEQRTRNYVLFFALLGLLGAFLAKGANEPFGGIYLWLFDHLPGFIMFRDPTKWYTLVAISYSILIPFTVWKIYEWLKSQPKFLISNFKFLMKSKIFNASNLFLLVIVFCLLYLIRPALLGQLSGTFKTTQIPQDYIKLEKFLSSQNNFSRTLWVPTLQRFGFYSNSHPAIPAQDFFKTVDYSKIISKMKISEDLLQESAVKYVIVPYDSQGEIFLKDRKYDEKLYQEVVRGVSKIPWLKPVDCLIAKLLNCTGNPFGKIAVFEVDPPAGGPKDHFYFKDLRSKIKDQSIKYQYISPVEYRIEVINAKKSDVIVFSESYDKNWIAKTPNYTLYAKRYGLFNSFVLPKDGSYSLRVYYTPQDYINIGMIVSGFSLILILSALVYLRKKKI